MTESATHVRIVEKTPAYWRVVFDYPPFNIVDATIFEGLQDLLARMDASPSLRVVVFESANPEFYLAHFDLSEASLSLLKTAGPSRRRDPDGYVHPPHKVAGRQYREDSRARPRQRVRSR